jgi:hypothetical protein
VELGAAQAEIKHIKKFTQEAHGKCAWVYNFLRSLRSSLMGLVFVAAETIGQLEKDLE